MTGRIHQGRKAAAFAALLIPVLLFSPGIPTGTADPADCLPGEALVLFQPGTPEERVAAILGLLSLKRGRSLGTPLAIVVTFSTDRPVMEVVAELRKLPEVKHAEPNRITPAPVPPPGGTGLPTRPQ